MSANQPIPDGSSPPSGSSREPGSISLLIQDYKDGGNVDAFTPLWQRYIDRLLEVARTKLGGLPRRVANEDDIAQAVFASLHDAVQKGHYPNLNDRDDLWEILLNLAERKAIDWKRYMGRGRRDFRRTEGESAGGKMSNESPAGTGMANVACPDPTPESVVVLCDQINHLLGKLPEDQREIVRQKLDSHANDEIAAQSNCAPRTVERKLQLIRVVWAELIEKDRTSD